MKKIRYILLFLCSTALFAQIKPPQLVVQIVIDQLRGDLINRYHQHFGSDGFNFLLAHGLDYHNTHHPHANTVTCAGHATIATGSYPALHGIVNNDWYDKQTKQSIYCVEDLDSKILPTSRSKKPQPGRSPHLLMASTLSDELILAQTGRAFAVSLKDRGAITLAGHAGKAFWFDKENGGFITSQHYYKTYPHWVNDWNKSYESKDEIWLLSQPKQSYNHAKTARFTNRFPGFNANFPHHLGRPDSATYYKFLSMTPMADELTADFAIKLLAEEKLGKQAGKTDYLAVSFSAVDAIGHQFGPNSLESEDNLLRLDKTLAKFLSALKQEVGLENTLIVLTADHGVSDSPVYLAAHQIKQQQSLTSEQLKKLIEDDLRKQFNLSAKTLEAIALPYVYLDHQLISEQKLSLNKVKHRLTELLSEQESIFQVYSLPLAHRDDWLSAKVDKMAYPGRSGDLYLVSPAYQTLKDKGELRVAHGTPWLYDSYVPLIFVHPAFKPERISRAVSTTDIAPTLAAILNVKAPSAAFGQPLLEVMTTFNKEK